MKNPILRAAALAVALSGLAALISAPPAESAATTSNGSLSNFMGVRVQWLDLAGNHPHTDCTVHIVNRSISEPITIEEFVVVGPGGRQDVIGVASSTVGMTLGPLQELRVPMNATYVPGAAPQTAVGQHGIRNAVIKWSGPSNAMHSEAIQERYATGQTDQRTHWVSRGYEIVD